MKIEEQKKAVRSGYDMDIIPSDLALSAVPEGIVTLKAAIYSFDIATFFDGRFTGTNNHIFYSRRRWPAR